ncbi:MAG: ATPase inhibitor subunit zeta, partial [Burkholderiales bacterium]
MQPDVAVQQSKNGRVWENAMTTYDNREKAFENKFARDGDLKFKAESRRNKALAEWAAAKLGISGDAIADYV